MLLTNEAVDWDSRLAAYAVRADKMGEFDELYTRYCGETVPPMATPGQLMAAHLQLAKNVIEACWKEASLGKMLGRT